MITVREQLKCVREEIERRKRAYKTMVEAGKMSPGKAEKEILIMQSVANSLLLLPQETALIELN